MGVPFEKASRSAQRIEMELDYLLEIIDPDDIYPDTLTRLERCRDKLAALFTKVDKHLTKEEWLMRRL